MVDLSPAWPSLPLAPGIKHTITEFYRLLDIYTATACRQWAELFTPGGEMVIEARDNLHVQGRQALEAERKQSWVKLEKRDHRVHGIYIRNSDGTDLVVLGENDVTMRNGVVFWQGYAQRFVLRRVRDADMEGEERYLIECFQSYLDSAPLAKAIAAGPLREQPPMPE